MRMGLVRWCAALWLASILVAASPPVRAEAPAAAPRGWPVVGGPAAYSSVTGHHLTGAFLLLWRARGGLVAFGEPLSEATPDATGRWAQVTERALLTLPPGVNPAHLGNAGLVTIEPLGRELIAGRLDESPFQPVLEPYASQAAWFPATGHTLANGFLDHWLAHDGAATLGPPLSEEYEEAGRVVQWFERGRLDYDPATGALERAALGRASPRAAALIRPPTPPASDATPLEFLSPLPSAGRLAAWADNGFGVGHIGVAGVLAPVGKGRALPLGVAPTDLTPAAEVGLADGLATVRGAILPDLIDLAAAARARGLTLTVLSGYRSTTYQASVFERETRRLQAEGLDPEAARREANRFVALPGESEHHLGTAVDFNRVDDAFALTPEALFLAEEGWRFGFLIAYPAGAEARTGYVYEPWHLRWVGRPLAAAIHADGYLASGRWGHDQFTLQDYLDTAQVLLPGVRD
jgi:D-alanyl-D-alanine carboxypeptidase